jgi:hypothetical protein
MKIILIFFKYRLMILEPLKYFTLWTWTLFLLQPDHPRHLFHSSLCSAGGFYFTYISPQEFIIPSLHIKLQGITLKLIDMITHHSLFLYCLYLHYNTYLYYTWREFIKMTPIFFFYFLVFFNPNTYGLNWKDVLYLCFFYFPTIFLFKHLKL